MPRKSSTAAHKKVIMKHLSALEKKAKKGSRPKPKRTVRRRPKTV